MSDLRRRKAAFWVTAGGWHVPLCELTDDHLKRIVRRLRRQAAEAREVSRENVQAMLAMMDEDSYGYARFHKAAEQLEDHNVESFAEVMFHRDPPYASYLDLTDEAVERQILDVFGSPRTP